MGPSDLIKSEFYKQLYYEIVQFYFLSDISFGKEFHDILKLSMSDYSSYLIQLRLWIFFIYKYNRTMTRANCYGFKIITNQHDQSVSHLVILVVSAMVGFSPEETHHKVVLSSP